MPKYNLYNETKELTPKEKKSNHQKHKKYSKIKS